MSDTQRAPAAGVLQLFRRKPEPPPAPPALTIGKAMLATAYTCVEELERLPLDYQMKCWDLVEDLLKDHARKTIAADHSED